VDARALDAAFADADSRRVDRGILKIKGQRYSHDRLAALPSRTVVDLALPWRRGAAPLARLDGGWVYLEAEIPYPARFIEGARESQRRQTGQSRHVAALAKDAPKIDALETKLRFARRLAPATVLPSATELDLGGETRARARAIRPTSAAPALTPAELKRGREMAETERLEARQNRG
jgi:hypothetical protein